MKRLLLPLLVIASLLGQPLGVLAQDVLPGFNPSILIPDAAFADIKTFGGPAGIQQFLESKGSVLANTSPDFLAKLSEPLDPALKTALGDPQPNLGRLRTAAEIIWDASQASGLNPQVILVTLNKEQGLITARHSPDRLQRALNYSMGFDCPDSSGCGNLFPGFYYQLMGNVDTEGNRYLGAAKSLMKSFNTPGGRGPTIANAAAKVGDSVLIHNTLGDYNSVFASQFVTIGNRATAALYRYTPHVFNGNYNFWKFFTAWFKYPNGTLLASTFDRSTYIIQDGARSPLPAFVAKLRGLDLTTAITASPTELDGYPLGPVYGPPDNTLASIDGALFMFMRGVKHPVSGFVLAQRKLDMTKNIAIAAADASVFPQGDQLTPSNGTVLRGELGKDVYLVENDTLKKYSALTFKQYNVAKKVQVIPDAEVASYPKKGYVAPLNGTVIKAAAGGDAYIVSERRRLPLTPELIKNLGIKTKDIVTLTDGEELSSLPIGPISTPKEGTFFSYGGDYELFLFKGGAKHPISRFVAKQRGIKPDYAFEVSIAGSWPEGIALAPKDGTLVKSASSPTTYIVTNGQLRELTAEVFKNLKLSFKNVAVMPDADIAALAKGTHATPAENSYFSVGKDGPIYVFQNGAKRLIVPFVAKQRGMTPDHVFTADAVNDWPDGIPVAPRDGTLIQAKDGKVIYLVSLKKLRPLSDTAFKRRGFKTKNIQVLPSADVDALPKGEPLAK